MAPNWATTDRTYPSATRASIRRSACEHKRQQRVLTNAVGGYTMADISLEAVTGKLNRVGYEAFIQALRHAKSAGNRNVELAHWLFHILQQRRAPTSR